MSVVIASGVKPRLRVIQNGCRNKHELAARSSLYASQVVGPPVELAADTSL